MQITLRNLVLYSLLIIATPFILLQNYFQWAISTASRLYFEVGTIQVPWILFITLILMVVVLGLTYKQITKYRIIGIGIVVALWILGQNSTDYYFSHKFYELQHNWHYIAYGIFSFIIYRYLKKVKRKDNSQIILITVFSAVSLSAFDEFIQIPLSDRTYDICDIGKDYWGATIGLYFVFFVFEDGKFYQRRIYVFQKVFSGLS